MPSPVWTYFKKMGNPLCISCGKLVTSTNTTNMWFHLEKQHHKIYIDLKKKKNQNAEQEVDGDPVGSSFSENLPTNLIVESSQLVTKDNDETIHQQQMPMSTNQPSPAKSSESRSAGHSLKPNDVSSATSETPVPKSMVQTVLRHRFVKTSKAQAERITMAIAYFIAVACVAYSIVENTGFRYLMNILAPNYHVPSRKVFSHERVPKLHQATKQIIIEEIKEADYFAITTDGWTSTNSHKFIALTLSFIDENWKLISRVLACHDLNISNTGENIQCLVDNILIEFKIEKSRISAGVSDRGSNCIAAINLLGFEHVPCFAHAVNTKMEEMLKLDFIAPTLKKIKNIYKLSRNGGPKKKQFKFAIDNEMALYKFVTTYEEMDQSDLITPDDIARIKAILLVMEPMEKYVTTLGSETVATASIIVPLIIKLDTVFAKFKFHDAMASFRIKKFFRSITKFFKELYIEEKSLLEIATYLDPRFKDSRRSDLEVILKREIRELQANPRGKANSSMERKKSNTTKKSALEELFEETDDGT
ncbi:E3 SUMO-protein ligase ZBED1, partial [Pseudolycoriella hygida]